MPRSSSKITNIGDRFSYKTLILICILLLIGIITLSKINQKPNPAAAGWWDEAWGYRKSVVVSNSSGSTLTNQRIKFTVDSANLITNNKLETSCNDFRVTDYNGKVLNHWVANCNTSSTSIYVKISSLPATDTILYIYYGNPSAPDIETVLGNIDNPGTSCQMMKNQGSITQNGLYYIAPGGNDSDTIQVYCDTTTTTGDWTLVIQNSTNTVPPKPDWNSAINNVNVTGTLSTDLTSFDLLLGLKHWNYLGNTALIQMGSNPTTISKRAHYNSITLNTSNSYQLNLSGETIDLGGTSPGFYSGHNGRKFSTYDADNDTNAGNCATNYSNTAWWYSSCWSGNMWGGGDVGSYQNKPYWLGSSTDYYDYGAIFIGGGDTMKNTTSGSLSSEEQSPGPIAYWKFDEGSGTTINDSSSNRINGILYNTVWKSDQCISGKCLEFNGSNTTYGEISDNDDLSPSSTGAITYSAWVKPYSINAVGRNWIITKGTGSNYEWALGTNGSGAPLCNSWSLPGANHFSISSPNALPLNTWSYISCVLTPGVSASLYVNGKLVSSSGSPNGSMGNGNATIQIGKRGDDSEAEWNGLIDEVKIYPYARSANQIKTDFNSPSSLKGASVNVGTGTTAANKLKDNLIVYWKLDEGVGSNAFDQSSQNNNGVFGAGSSAPTWSNNGKFDKALSFANSSYVEISNNPSFTLTQEGFTYTAWINATALPNTYNMFMGHYLPYFNVRSTGILHMSMTAGGSQRSVYGTTVLSTGNWYHVAATYDSQGYMKVYLNGKLDATAGPFLTPGNNSSNFYVGKWDNTATGNFTGLIDEVKVYNSALSADEIKLDYNRGSSLIMGSSGTDSLGNPDNSSNRSYCIPGDSSTCNPPVGEWNFNERIGNTADDASGNNLSGTLTNGPTWISGKYGSALNFTETSNQHILSSNGSNQTFTSGFTAQAWIKKSGAGSGYDWIIGKGTDFGLTLNSGSTTQLRVFKDSGGVYADSNNFTNIADNKWHHVAVTFDDPLNSLQFYIDSKPVGVGNSSAFNFNPLNTTSSNYYIGAWVGPTHYFNGQIDQVLVYNYARTPAQIALDYNRGAPLAWWKLDECQGSIAYDSSENNYHANISVGVAGSQVSAGTCTTANTAFGNGSVGKINSSFTFDGTDDFIDIGNTSAFNFGTQDFTVSFWGKSNNYLTSRGIVTKGIYWTSNGPGFAFTNISNPHQVYFNVYDGTTQTAINTGIGPTYPWTHFIGIKRGNNIEVWINGTLKTSAAAPANSINNNQSLTIGKGPSGFWDGQLDDLKIFNYALTKEQIKNIINNGAVSFGN